MVSIGNDCSAGLSGVLIEMFSTLPCVHILQINNTGSNGITACNWHFFNAHNIGMESSFYLSQLYVIVHKTVITCMKL